MRFSIGKPGSYLGFTVFVIISSVSSAGRAEVRCADAASVCRGQCHAKVASCGPEPAQQPLQLDPEPVKRIERHWSAGAIKGSHDTPQTMSVAKSTARADASAKASELCHSVGGTKEDIKWRYEKCDPKPNDEFICWIEGSAMCVAREANPAHSAWLQQKREFESAMQQAHQAQARWQDFQQGAEQEVSCCISQCQQNCVQDTPRSTGSDSSSTGSGPYENPSSGGTG